MTGGSAFPDAYLGQSRGMDLRDFFAAKAMQALIKPEYLIATCDGYYPDIAATAYKYADAMLYWREKH